MDSESEIVDSESEIVALLSVEQHNVKVGEPDSLGYTATKIEYGEHAAMGRGFMIYYTDDIVAFVPFHAVISVNMLKAKEK